MILGLANPGLWGVRKKVHSHTQPCLEFEVRQGDPMQLGKGVISVLIIGTIPRRSYILTYTNTHTQKNMRAHTYTQTHKHSHAHAQFHTHTHRQHTQITKPCEYTRTQTRTRTLARAHTHTQAHTYAYAYGYAMGATAVHTLFSSYAHTIILLC